MAITLPNPRNVFLPSLPPSLKDNEAVRKYLEDLKIAIEKEFAKAFENTYTIVNTGTSGSFEDSAGNTVTVSNGIITGLV